MVMRTGRLSRVGKEQTALAAGPRSDDHKDMIRRFALPAALALAALVTFGTAAAAAGGATIGGSWTQIAPLPAAAAILTVTGGADGRVYAFGFCQGTCHQLGGDVGYGRSVTYVYSPGAGKWHKGRPAPDICSDAEASAPTADGTIRLGGCWTDITTDAGFRVADYDPAAKTWSLEPGHGPYVDPISAAAAANGDTYWYGQTLRHQDQAVFISGDRIVTETSAGSFHSGARQPKHGPEDGIGIGTDGAVYVAGGSQECHPEFGACDMPPVEAWVPQLNQWFKPTVLPTSRIRVAVTNDSRGRIFVIGGMAADSSRLFAKVEVFRPGKGWATAPRLPSARFAALATSTSDGRVWVIGGYDQFGTPLQDGFVFTPGADRNRWSPAAP